MGITKGDIFYILSPDKKGKGRPAVIVSNNQNNLHSTVVEVVYLTRRAKKPLPTHAEISIKGEISTVLCEQIDSVSTDRLGKHIGHIKYSELVSIDVALRISLALNS